jgi:gamma-glutamylcyclotransferase (GGCT)/AIG2-like uncharacterized protein YtfP
MAIMTQRLFSYGTLQDPNVQKALFGKHRLSKSAYIENWGRYMSKDRYLFVKPLSGGRVYGAVLELDDHDLERADRWEDLTVYERETCHAILGDGSGLNAFIYTRRMADGTEYNGTELHGLTLREIRDDICHAFK